MAGDFDVPLILDIDGTLTRSTGNGIDPRVIDPIQNWEGTVIFATGKAFPYPVTLAHFIGVPEIAVAENGGIVNTGNEFFINGDRDAPQAVLEEYQNSGHTVEWGFNHPLNRWRETELAVSLNQDQDDLERIAEKQGLKVIDTGYAYHIKQPDLDKGKGIATIEQKLGINVSNGIAIGDSINDVSVFEMVEHSFAVENADSAAKAAADTVINDAHADGTLSVIDM